MQNGRMVPSVVNGTMLTVKCVPGVAICNLTLDLKPVVRLESIYGSSVSVFRGPTLFAADLGRDYTRYSPACEQPPYSPQWCDGIGPER